tara:strand:+ start:1458 stop:2066 length:609 start_codon:yes stop_codon:yes gene_type:complete
MPRKKVKDMPRKQQMAVKAAMAEKAAGKKSPTKMVSARDNNIAKREKKRATRNKIKRVIEGVMTGGGSEIVRKAKQSYKKYKANKDVVKKGVKGVIAGGGAGVKRGLKDKLVKQKVVKKPNWRDEYERDHINKKTNKSLFETQDKRKRKQTDPSPGKLKMKTSPALAKLSASCKAAARRKFKVYPSAYANMWASRTQKKGKC